MPNFVISRDIPGASQLTREQLQAISLKSCEVLGDLGPRIQWVHSYVTADRIYCVYRAPDADLIREHANCPAVTAVETLVEAVQRHSGPAQSDDLTVVVARGRACR